MAAASLPITVLTDRYPELSETFVAGEVLALRRAGHRVTVEAVARAARPAAGHDADHIWEDEATRSRLIAMAALALRHPLACLRDLRDRRRWRREEPVVPLRMLAPAARRLERAAPVHLHVHFAAGAALAGMRIARITGIPWSVTAHGYDIYQRPANLPEKLRAAAFATSGCEYTVRTLRAHGGRVHVVVMGVDVGAFRRSGPPPERRTILAVGRLVEKKGFGDLVEAVALMDPAPDRVLIAGDGPLAEELRARARPPVELLGAVSHEQVRELLEEAAVLAMPCVVAADGDRDSMPVVVKEALAMEVPVVATDEVGLPEVVRPAWGRLVAPHDPAALAVALQELLSLPASERAEMGRRGRAHVAAHADADREAARLAALIAEAHAN